MARSPADTSPHWADQGVPVPSSGGLYRQTSYGINNYLSRHAPTGSYRVIEKVTNPAEIVHFVYMAETGPFAGADHTHVENWNISMWPPLPASGQLQIDKFGGPPHDYTSVSNWGFLDGHAATLTFGDVYQTVVDNNFNPGLP